MTTTDRLTVLGIGVAVVLAIVGGSCSTNARIGDLRADMNARFAEVNARFIEVNARFADTNARIDELRAEMRARIDELRAEMRARIDELRAEMRARFGASNVEREAEHAELRRLGGRASGAEPAAARSR